jgi:hypothetical protein
MGNNTMKNDTFDTRLARLADWLQMEGRERAEDTIQLARQRLKDAVTALTALLALHDDAVFISGDDDARKVDDALSAARTIIEKSRERE